MVMRALIIIMVLLSGCDIYDMPNCVENCTQGSGDKAVGGFG